MKHILSTYTSMIARSCTALFLLIVIPSSTVAVWDGKAKVSNPDRVAVKNSKDLRGTAGLVQYDMCVLTADHVISNPGILFHTGLDAGTTTPATKDQRSHRRMWHPNRMATAKTKYSYLYDFAIVALKELKDNGADIKLKAGDHTVYPLAKAEGLIPNPAEETDNPVPALEKIIKGTGKPLFSELPAYGIDKNGDTVNDLRQGYDHLEEVHIAKGTFNQRGKGMGGIYRPAKTRYETTGPALHHVTKGDSGMNRTSVKVQAGPGKKVYGVVNEQVPKKATYGTENHRSKSALFNSANDFDRTKTYQYHEDNDLLEEIGNYEMVKFMIADTCSRRVSLSIQGEGSIQGTVNNPKDKYGEQRLNHSVDCSTLPGGGNDCEEALHRAKAGVTDSMQEELVLTASPANGWQFFEWKTPLKHRQYCTKCLADPKNPVCKIKFDDVGHSTTKFYTDMSDCQAVFVRDTVGNCTIDPGEECDECQVAFTATCDPDGTTPVCGDGLVNTLAGEECDDSNTDDGDGCDSSCIVETLYCGNGIVDAGEACDDGTGFGVGEHSYECNNDCTLAVCGDGLINPLLETCDDGNTNDGDGCSSACLDEECGNYIVDINEECDDGNTDDGDGCDSSCYFEPFLCGNGVVDTGEDCDDAGESSTCDYDCTDVMCGDIVINETAGEDCDDGNTDNGDGCDEFCIIEMGLECGNDVTEWGEECDDGEDTEFCNMDCTLVECGDSYINDAAGEECDEGGESPACNINCTYSFCGDSILNETAGEECDDGNTDNGDGCDEFCMNEV